MGKNVYSIVLSDNVVELLDRYAAKLGVSRSTAINDILAQHLSFVTPERRITDILRQAAELLDDDTFISEPTFSGGCMTLRTPVRFRYNPTVICSVELYPSSDITEGELRAWARTTSAALTQALETFFETLCSALLLPKDRYSIKDGRLLIKLQFKNSDSDDAAYAISSILRLIESSQRRFFSLYPDCEACRKAVLQEVSNFNR